jgi:low molecular weight protein-tyrosine phosphatase
MAEAILQDMVRQAGLNDHITVDSCGMGAWHVGDSPHRGTRRVLEAHAIPYHHRARQIALDDLSTADYLIALDSDNLAGIQRLGDTAAEVALLLTYAPQLGLIDVPDPYYTDRFDETYELVEAGCRGLLNHIRDKEAL